MQGSERIRLLPATYFLSVTTEGAKAMNAFGLTTNQWLETEDSRALLTIMLYNSISSLSYSASTYELNLGLRHTYSYSYSNFANVIASSVIMKNNAGGTIAIYTRNSEKELWIFWNPGETGISAWALYPEDVKDHLSKVRSLESVYNTYGGKQNKNTWTAYYNNPDRISYIQQKRNYHR